MTMIYHRTYYESYSKQRYKYFQHKSYNSHSFTLGKKSSETRKRPKAYSATRKIDFIAQIYVYKKKRKCKRKAVVCKYALWRLGVRNIGVVHPQDFLGMNNACGRIYIDLRRVHFVFVFFLLFHIIISPGGLFFSLFPVFPNGDDPTRRLSGSALFSYSNRFISQFGLRKRSIRFNK